MVFKNKPTESATPTIVSLTVDNKKALDNIHTKAGETYAASVNALLGVDMQTNVKDSSNKILHGKPSRLIAEHCCIIKLIMKNI